MNILSIFDGVSCARVALERAGIKVDSYTASEIDKYAIQISRKNYPDIIHIGDVKNIPHSVAPEAVEGMYDLLIGGSPCTDLSIAKKDRKGLRGDKSILFWEYVRILKLYKPKYFILENVASMPKEDKDIITKELGVEPIMINASLVSAQSRKRLFWHNLPGVIQPEDRHIYLKDILESGESDRVKSHTIDASYYKGANWKQYKEKHRRQLVLDGKGDEKLKSNTVRSSGRGSGVDDKHNWDSIRIGQLERGGQAGRIYDPEGKSVSIKSGGGGQGAKTGLYMIQKPRGYNKGGVKALDGKTPALSASRFEMNNKLVDDFIVRKLTPIECERLQGLPDNFSEGISNSQRYKCLGNAFNVDVVSHILSFIQKEDL